MASRNQTEMIEYSNSNLSAFLIMESKSMNMSGSKLGLLNKSENTSFERIVRVDDGNYQQKIIDEKNLD